MTDPQPTYGRFTAEIERPGERTAEDLVSEAEECLNLYRKVKRDALYNTPRSMWLAQLRAAQSLLDEAERREIEGS